jgi:pimeloyl-ACP methyl ester carboxylesterase
MRTTLVSIETDTIPLEGAFYEPEGRASAGAALLFHGNTMNFYVGPPRFLPPALTRLGFACLAFNRRGHDVLSTRASRAVEGGAFQLVREALADNHVAAEWLAQRGFPRPVVIGHSHGGMLAVRHVADHPATSALVLLSAHCGGKGLVPLGSKAGLLAGSRIDEITREARALVEAGRGRELMLLPGWWYVVTAEGFLDMLTELPDVLELARRSRVPSSTCAAATSRETSTPQRSSTGSPPRRARSRSSPAAATSTWATRRASRPPCRPGWRGRSSWLALGIRRLTCP